MSSDEPMIARIAADSSAIPSQEHVPNPSLEELKTTASDPGLTEDLALLLLQRNDLPGEILELVSKNGTVAKSRKVRLALVEHPRTPRHLSMPMLRHLFTFDLMQVALASIVPADVKLAAEESLIRRLETISIGEKITLARRASGRVAGESLLDPETRVVSTALENARLTEPVVIKVLMRQDVSARLVELVCHHAKWSVRSEVRIALLRNEKTPLARALEFARSFPASLVREILQTSQLPAHIKVHLLQDAKERSGLSLDSNF
jgi:hypothetical protein